MKLPELIKYLIEPDLLKHYILKEGIDKESEALLICMQGDLNIKSEIAIFELEKIEDNLIFGKDGIRYVELFSINHAIDLIEFDLQLKDNGYSDIQIAERLIDYRLNDA